VDYDANDEEKSMLEEKEETAEWWTCVKEKDKASSVNRQPSSVGL